MAGANNRPMYVGETVLIVRKIVGRRQDEKLMMRKNYCWAQHTRFLSKGIVDQVEKNLDIPIRALQEELQRNIEKGKYDTTIKIEVRKRIQYSSVRYMNVPEGFYMVYGPLKTKVSRHMWLEICWGLDGCIYRKDLIQTTDSWTWTDEGFSHCLMAMFVPCADLEVAQAYP
ncbi:hypothetical protein Tco_0786886 [Tanacetum coccineum]